MSDRLIPLDVLEAADKAATPGPFAFHHDGEPTGGELVSHNPHPNYFFKVLAEMVAPADAEAFLLYREWGPRMVQALRELRELAVEAKTTTSQDTWILVVHELLGAVLRVTGDQP